MIATAVQGDVDGVAKRSHFPTLPRPFLWTKAAEEILDNAPGRSHLDQITKSAAGHQVAIDARRGPSAGVGMVARPWASCLRTSRSAPLAEVDPAIAAVLDGELGRQQETLELIASENFVPRRCSSGRARCSPTSTPRATPGTRYYGGCEVVDVVEQLAIDRAKELFGAEHANVQPHSGAQANMAAYLALLEPGRHGPGHGPRPRRPPHPRACRSTSPACSTTPSPTTCAATTDGSTTTRSSGSPASTGRS